ncbi:lectin-like [Asparagus officinalis]|uniref:lectin-like n=1 Tax=Asparagus officinalis TaxID=4686 RepID=UPI00098E1001|nr:lectin-like [Asparagus officinalis]XP_020269177.1 lectin-like [Asparagus officinalis]
MSQDVPKKLPHNLELLLQKAELPSVEDVHDHFKAGIFLNKKTVRCWTDRTTHSNSFMLYSRALSIERSEDPSYWRWLWLEGDMDVEVAEMLKMCPVKIKGSFEMNHFNPGEKYEVMFLMMMKNPHVPDVEPLVKMTVELPNGTTQEKELSLKAMVPGQWAQVKAGEFVGTEEGGDVGFSLSTSEEVEWEKGLIVEGVLIEPCVDRK